MRMHTGGPVASVQPQSAHSSHVNTPRSARPGTMGSLLDVPNAGFGAIGHPAAPKYPSQGSLDGELPGYLKPASGAQAPIGRASRTSQVLTPVLISGSLTPPAAGAHTVSSMCWEMSVPLLCHSFSGCLDVRFARMPPDQEFGMVQTEVPSSVRAFWETGSSNPGGLASNLGMNSARAPGESR